jgi:hypothetical protein
VGEFEGSNQALRAWFRSVFILGVVATCASAVEFAGGTGEAGDPYQIGTAEQLIAVGQDPNLLDKHFVLIRDIDLDPNTAGGRVFTQAVIAPDTNPEDDFGEPVFTGSFDGQGHAIKRLTIRGDAVYVGLFGRLGKNGLVHDLVLEDVSVTSSGYYIAGLVGYNRGMIADCHVSGVILGGTGVWRVGLGLVAGENSGRIDHCDVDGSLSGAPLERGIDLGLLTGVNWGAVSDCAAAGAITSGADFSATGGLIGMNWGSVADCHTATGISLSSKSAMTASIGGLVGASYGSIYRCFATGDVMFGEYTNYTGGLAGYSTGTIVGCYATGAVSGEYANNQLGGLTGLNWGHIAYCWASGNVTGSRGVGGLVGQNWASIAQCYATGRVVAEPGQWTPVGGLLADSSYLSNVSHSFWDIEASGITKSDGGTGLSTLQMQDPQTFLTAGWDFVAEQTNGTDEVWLVPDNHGYPLLSFFAEQYCPHVLDGAGTPEDPYRIATAEDLGAICHYDATACYKLVADVNLAGITWTAPVIPSFEGRFDGNGFTIANLTLQGDCFLGLFGVLWRGAVVEDLNITGAKIVAGYSGLGLGLLAVENWGRVANCRATGEIVGGGVLRLRKHGAFVENNHGTITNCEPIGSSGPYTIIVTDPQEVWAFVGDDEMDEVWIPDVNDLTGLDGVLRTYLDSDTPGRPDESIDREYILFNLPLYNREYSGFTKKGRKYIICQMHTFYDDEPFGPPDNMFSMILDGGCGVVRIVFDAVTGAVVSIACNGVA